MQRHSRKRCIYATREPHEGRGVSVAWATGVLITTSLLTFRFWFSASHQIKNRPITLDKCVYLIYNILIKHAPLKGGEITEECAMSHQSLLSQATAFIVLAFLSAIAGWSGILTENAETVARILFAVFLVLFCVTLVYDEIRIRRAERNN